MANEMATPTTPTVRDTCDPMRVRESRQRPKASVPRRKTSPPSAPNRCRSSRRPSSEYSPPRTNSRIGSRRDLPIILRHIMPNLSSYLIVTATLALPGYILGESALSFLGLGVKEPMASWGLLLRDAQNFRALRLYPWLLAPGALILISVMAFNFVGDALRDAADLQST